MNKVQDVTTPGPGPSSENPSQVIDISRKNTGTKRRRHRKINIKERCCACLSIMLTAIMGILIAAACTAMDMGVNILDPTTYDRAWTDRSRVNKNPSHEEGGSVFVDPLYTRSSYSLYHQENQTRCQCYCKSPTKTSPTPGPEEEYFTSRTAPWETERSDIGSSYPWPRGDIMGIDHDSDAGPSSCYRIERQVCSRNLPYQLSNRSDVSIHAIGPLLLDPDFMNCDDNWFLVICSFLFPECQESPPANWRHSCACPDLIESIERNCADDYANVNARGLLQCLGTNDNDTCIRSATL